MDLDKVMETREEERKRRRREIKKADRQTVFDVGDVAFVLDVKKGHDFHAGQRISISLDNKEMLRCSPMKMTYHTERARLYRLCCFCKLQRSAVSILKLG